MEGAEAVLVEGGFIEAGVVAEFVKDGFADFVGELLAGGTGFHEGNAIEEDVRGEGGGGIELGGAVVDSEGFVIGPVGREVGGGGAIFDDEGDLVEPLGVLRREGGDGGIHELVEGFAGKAHEGMDYKGQRGRRKVSEAEETMRLMIAGLT
jgi:hypothetical protein